MENRKKGFVSWVTSLTAAGILVVFSEPASALSCAQPLPGQLIYPHAGGRAPRNAVVIIFYRPLAQRGRLDKATITDQTTGKIVSVKTITSRASGMIRLVPLKLLPEKHVFKVAVGSFQLGSFTSGDHKASPDKPKLRAPVVTFTSFTSASMTSSEGRSANAKMWASRDAAPVALEILARFVSSDKKVTENRFVAPLRAEIQVASNEACAALSPAPKAGRYEITVTPWTSTGRKGASKKAKGTIKE